MKIKYWLIGAVALLVIVGFIFWLTGDNDDEVTLPSGDTCIKRAGSDTWNLDNVNYTSLAVGTRDFINSDFKAVQGQVLSFFKAIDRMPTIVNIRKYRNQIQAWLSAEPNTDHWEVAVGEKLCAQS